MPVDPRHVIKMRTKSGEKEFVLFVGLLDLGHQMGLRAVETKIVIEVSNPLERSWVVEAIGTFIDAEGKDRVWSAYGDASPANSQMRGAELRHAETRAAARMLRMATNCGITAFEELGPQGDDRDDDPLPTLPRDNGPVRRVSRPPAGAPPAAPLPVARHSPGTVGAPPAPRRETPRPLVVIESGAPVCELCQTVLTAAQATISQKHFSGRNLCPMCQKAERSVMSSVAQTSGQTA